MVTVPIFSASTPRWTEKLILDAVRYTLGINWNAREAAWYVDLADGLGNPICMGIKIVPEVLLWNQYKGFGGFPPGDLFLLDTLQNLVTTSLGYADLGARYLLLYLESGDLAAGIL
jgi:hypothetical protein